MDPEDPERPLFAVLPKPIKIYDEIAIKGRTRDDAKEFSVNLTIDQSPTPSSIAYHFNVRFDEGIIIGNSKDNCIWNSEEIIENDYVDGPVSHLISGEDFSLIFFFGEHEIIVYGEEDNTKNFICKFGHRFNIENITTFQVWGDIEKIKELTFRYH